MIFEKDKSLLYSTYFLLLECLLGGHTDIKSYEKLTRVTVTAIAILKICVLN